MDFFSILTLLGGLAMFLYGMQVMGDGLAKVSGGKLEQILENLTSSPIKAVLLGAGVTAVIQSSSATTVMVVGFVNSGIMTLKQAVGVIMGANIGTTITSWILSLAGIESENFFIQLLKPTSFAPILAMIGVVCLMFLKEQKKKDIGVILLGFSVLMFGMDTMSAAVKPLADVPEFTSLLLKFSNPILGIIAGTVLTAVIQSSSASVGILQALCLTGAVPLEFTSLLLKFSNPILGIIAGTVLTAVIQSSSASVGILQALCLTGAVPFGSALPIIMGQNIGTCVTALLSAIGAKKNAKRAAMMHLYFNLIGTIVFMSVFYLINSFVHFGFLEEAASPAGIAIMHSAFNIIATVVWLPFSGLLVKLACLTIRDKEEAVVSAEDQEFMILESRFLEKPAFAVEQGRTAARRMAEDCHQAFTMAVQLIDHYQETGVEKVEKMESKVDRYEDELGTYLVKLSHKDLSERDSHSLSMMLHCIGDFERISDHAVNIMESAQELHSKGLSFSEKATQELRIITSAVEEILQTALSVFTEQDVKKAASIEPLEEVVDELSQELKRRHVQRLRKGTCTIEMGFILSDITTSLERIADHCSNIGVCVTQVREDLYDTHSHLDEMKNEPDANFYRNLEEVREKYLLP